MAFVSALLPRLSTTPMNVCIRYELYALCIERRADKESPLHPRPGKTRDAAESTDARSDKHGLSFNRPRIGEIESERSDLRGILSSRDIEGVVAFLETAFREISAVRFISF